MNNTTTVSGVAETGLLFYIGIATAVFANILNGVSYPMQKQGSAIGEPFFNRWCAIGNVIMILGEVCNFVAYGLAPASIVCPLGAIAVVVNQLGAFVVLHESFSFTKAMGTLLALIGALCIVFSSPTSNGTTTDDSVTALVSRAKELDFMIYGTTLLAAFIAAKTLEKEYALKNVLVYVVICSVMGALTVLLTKTSALILIESIFHNNSQFDQMATYVILFVFAATLVYQIIVFNPFGPSNFFINLNCRNRRTVDIHIC